MISPTASLRYWRLRIFSGMYLGYVCYYLARKSYTFAKPALMEDLGYSLSDLGLLASGLYIAYGASKFISGVMADRYSSRWLLSAGLICAGLTNVCFASSSTISALFLFWTVNGFFQGFGFPPIAKQLTRWFPAHQRGQWWSTVSTANNVGGALAPYFISVLMGYGTWRFAMQTTGVFAIVVGLLAAWIVRDDPQSLGFGPVDGFAAETRLPRRSGETRRGVREAVCNRWIMGFSVAYFAVYAVRTGLNDWMALYLHQEHNFSLIFATQIVGWFELGGFVGSFCSGWLSDQYFAGRRLPLMVTASACLCVVMLSVLLISGLSNWLYVVLLTTSGVLIFIPQAMLGLASAEIVDRRYAATAYGFTSGVAYMGAATAGYPLGKVIDTFGWNGFFVFLTLASALIVSILGLLALHSQADDSHPAPASGNPGIVKSSGA